MIPAPTVLVYAGTLLRLTFDLKDLEGEDDDRLLSSVHDVVTVGVVGIVGWKVGRKHPTAGGCEVGSTPCGEQSESVSEGGTSSRLLQSSGWGRGWGRGWGHVLRSRTVTKLRSALTTEQQPTGLSRGCITSGFLLVLKVAENPFPGLSLLWNRLLMMLEGAMNGLGATEPQPEDSRAPAC